MKHTLLLLFLSCFAFAGLAQQAIVISGKVSDDEGQPIRQAGASISHKGIGTATNAAGLFKLLVPGANLGDSLRITCIGFKSKLFAISALKPDETLNISLEKNTTTLAEVTVTYYDATKILKKAIDRIPQNYINHPHILRGFYRMYTYNDEAPLQLSEAVFDVYNFGYADARADLFKLIKARSEKNNVDFDSMEFSQRPNNIFEEDVVNHINTCGFLNEKGLTHHQYDVIGIVDIKGTKAFEIVFKEKPGSMEKSYRGKMYVDTKTYAFIYFDFGLSPETSGLGAGTFIGKSLISTGNTDIGLLGDHSQVSYQEVGNKWVLSGFDGNDSLIVKNEALKYDYVAHVKFNYQITAVDTAQKESFTQKIGRNESINSYKSNGDEKFWKDYNILLFDFDTEDIFRKLRKIDKAVKVK